MGHIFISYSSKDAEFALKLASSLEPFYDVWIDKDDIKGGSEWERMIQTAITDCDLFLIIVSTHSNDSNWVMRETILAENLKKYRIPILLDGDMPFRLLELQYIDFRGDYSGGLRDLLSVLQSQISQDKSSDEEIDRLIGAGVQAYFNQDVISAKNLLEQVTILNTKLSQKIQQLSDLLKAHFLPEESSQSLAEQMMSNIFVIERARIATETLYADDTTYEWSLEISASEAMLQQIDFVKYTLHPTFPQPIRIVRDRKSKFKLETLGWGTFRVYVEINFIDGSTDVIKHDLTFDVED